MLAQLEDVFVDARPDVVVVYGDTNSTLAGALAAAKLHLRVAHVEAGVRSFNRRMPEEVNRVAVDHVSDLLLCPTVTAMENLASEGLGSRAVLTGDVMYDSVMGTLEIAEQRSSVLQRLGLEPRGYALVTVHRAENTDDATRLEGLLEAFNRIAGQGTRVVFPVHPRTSAVMARELPGWSRHPLLDLIEPVGYLDMLRLLRHARLALTDSGGVQKEAFFVGCPCITLRGETEWVETVERGGNILAGVVPDEILAAVAAWEARLVAGVPDIFFLAAECFGGGRAAENIVRALLAPVNE
jgi:UDP-N-acetylglucosamine 2-epimerase